MATMINPLGLLHFFLILVLFSGLSREDNAINSPNLIFNSSTTDPNSLLSNTLPIPINLDLTILAVERAYNDVITRIRKSVQGNHFYHDIPIMVAPSQPTQFIEVRLFATRGRDRISVSLAIRKTDLYVVAYADPHLRKAFFFSDFKDIEPSIFPTRVPFAKSMLSFESGYVPLENTSGLKRPELQMSLEKLIFSMRAVSGREPQPKNQAKFLLYATQAFSEAARFKYLQKKFGGVVEANTGGVDYLVKALENEWDTISTAVKQAVRRMLKPPVVLAHRNGSRWQVESVDEIKPNIGILKFVK